MKNLRHCRNMLESFISTQKMGVQKALARKFKRFMSYKRDFVELLMSLLQGLMRDQKRLDRVRGAAGGEIRVPLRCQFLLSYTCQHVDM